MEYELKVARMELELSLATVFYYFRHSTLSLIRDCFIFCPGEKELEQKYDYDYNKKLFRHLKSFS